MIRKISIENFAIIKELDIPFKKGLTVITGETGSGKTLVLDALRVSMGQKADKIMVRNEEKNATINTFFNSETIKREIFKNGRTKSYINNELIPLNRFRNQNIGKVEFLEPEILITPDSSFFPLIKSFCINEI